MICRHGAAISSSMDSQPPFYLIRQTLSDEADKSNVWVSKEIFAALLAGEELVSRPRVCLRRNGRFIYAELLEIDKRVTKSLAARDVPPERKTEKTEEPAANAATILLNKWQRMPLGLNSGWDWVFGGIYGRKIPRGKSSGMALEDEPLNLSFCRGRVNNVRAALWISQHHPQIIVRCAYQLAKWGIVLGVIGIVISIFSGFTTLTGEGPFNWAKWLLLILLLPLSLLLIVAVWFGALVFPVCVVLRWLQCDCVCRKE